jgi:hypothetical protein
MNKTKCLFRNIVRHRNGVTLLLYSREKTPGYSIEKQSNNFFYFSYCEVRKIHVMHSIDNYH